MTEPKKPLPDTLHLEVYLDQKDAAIVLMRRLIKMIETGEVTVLSVLEHESSPGVKKHLEIVYTETKGMRQ
jgi:hypothetical protein